MGARRSAWLTSRLHARRVVKRLPSKSRRSDAGGIVFAAFTLYRRRFVLEAKILCVLAWRWKGGALLEKATVKFTSQLQEEQQPQLQQLES